MDIKVQQFPVLTSGQMNPFHEMFQNGLQSYMNIQKARYTPQTLQADIASKQAYAQNYLKQIAATALSNPLAVASMSNDQRNALVNMITNPSSSYSSLQNANTLNGGKVWDWAKSLFTGENPSPTTNNSVTQPSQPTIQSSADSGYAYDANGNNVVMPPQGVNAIANQGNNSASQPQVNSSLSNSGYIDSTTGIDLTDPRMNIFNRDFGTPAVNAAMAKQYPSPYQSLELKKRESSVTEGAKQQGAAMQKLNDQSLDATSNAYNLEKDLDTFHTLYNQSLLTGPGLGLLSSIGPTSNQLNQLSTSMQTGVASQLFGSKITNYKEQLARDLKLNPSMPAAAEKGAYERLKAASQRIQEYDNFVSYAQDNGISDPNKIKRLWNHYNIDMPIFDGKSLKVIGDNLNKGNDYLSAQLAGRSLVNKSASSQNSNQRFGADSASSGKEPQWPSSKEPKNARILEGQMPPQGNVWMVRPDGVQVPVHQSRVQEAKDKYNYRGINE